MPEPHSSDDLPETLPLDPAGSAVVIRAELGVELVRARVITEQALATGPFARFYEPSDLALYRGLLTQAGAYLTRAAALVADETFKPRPEEL